MNFHSDSSIYDYGLRHYAIIVFDYYLNLADRIEALILNNYPGIDDN